MRKIRVYCIVCAFILALLVTLMPSSSAAQIAVGVTVGFPPPDLPVYEQPLCPEDGYIWTPGYWAWDPDIEDYYWVPGTWVEAPEVGYLWTPGYWGWGGSGFIFNEGYWSFGLVGFYGGINYGFGYFGTGYLGGRWENGHFFYNQAVNNVNVTVVHNVYKTTVNERNVTRVSYNGGNGGVNARPTPEEERAAKGRRLPPAPTQRQHVQEARKDPQLRASANHGRPPIAATDRPGQFSGRGVVQAREGGAVHGGPKGGGGNGGRGNATHPNELPRAERVTPNTGDRKQDDKLRKEQDKLYTRQDQERQKLQQQQEREHQDVARRNGNEGERQQMEQRHQQQTQQLEQRHSQERQQLEQKATEPRQKH